MKAATKIVKLPALTAALDEESFEWLSDNLPGLCEALAVEVANGAKPDEVGRLVRAKYGREELAARLEQAARHIKRTA